MKDAIFSILQRVGRSFMLPIAILPVAGLFLGIGGSFTNMTMLEAYGLVNFMGPDTAIYSVLNILSRCGDIVFANLPLLFAMGVAIGMAKKEKEVAALSAVIAFFIMHTAIGTLIDINDATSYLLDGSTAMVVGVQSLQIGVFGGMIVGLGVSMLHNKFYKIQLPQVLSFFGGTRFIPIISAVTFLVVGIFMFYIWPVVQNGIYAVGAVVNESGYGGTFVYGLMERLLIPFGLHHVFYMPFWQTAVGGTAMIDGVLIEGAQNIFFAELASGNIETFSVSATRFMSGKFPLMIFGLPGAALAMYHTAKDSKKEVARGLLMSAALTSVITGITEPIEFTFLFVAPALYTVHCIGAGLAYMFMHMFNVGVGMTFSGGLIDLTLFGIMQGNDKTNWIMVVVVGIGYFIGYYGIFRMLITKLDLKTPGREDDSEETKLYTKADMQAQKDKGDNNGDGDNTINTLILLGLGGKNNLEDVDCCATRLRVTVKNADLVLEDKLKQSGAAGVIKKGKGVQVIYGPRVSVIKSNLEDFIDSKDSDNLVLPTSFDNSGSNSSSQSSSSSNNKDALILVSPMVGRIAPISESPDESFAQEMMGRGVVFFPTDGIVTAPCDGTINLVFMTKHAIGLETEGGIEILIHIGVDTVKLEGKPFNILIKEGQKVKAGEPLVKFDLDFIEKNAKSTATPMVFTNLQEDKTIELLTLGDVTSKTQILKIK